jgi:hypothetical protein
LRFFKSISLPLPGMALPAGLLLLLATASTAGFCASRRPWRGCWKGELGGRSGLALQFVQPSHLFAGGSRYNRRCKHF